MNNNSCKVSYPILTPNDTRRTEQKAFQLGVPSLLLMEHAAMAVMDELEKALGVGIAADIREIAVKHDANGAPYYSLSGDYARMAEERGITTFFLSITHEGDMAAAVCIAERNG